MDFRAEEKLLKEKIIKKKNKMLKRGKLANKRAGLGLGLNPEIKEVESSENSENESDNEQQGIRDERMMASPHKGSLRQSMDKSDKKTDKQAARNKKKQELKLTWKSVHVMSNILFLLLKEVDYEKLQQYGSLINMLYMALSTDISHKFRYKEKAKVNYKNLCFVLNFLSLLLAQIIGLIQWMMNSTDMKNYVKVLIMSKESTDTLRKL